MPRPPNPNSTRTTLNLSSTAKRALMAISERTGDDLTKVIELAAVHYLDFIKGYQAGVIERHPELAGPLRKRQRARKMATE